MFSRRRYPLWWTVACLSTCGALTIEFSSYVSGRGADDGTIAVQGSFPLFSFSRPPSLLELDGVNISQSDPEWRFLLAQREDLIRLRLERGNGTGRFSGHHVCDFDETLSRCTVGYYENETVVVALTATFSGNEPVYEFRHEVGDPSERVNFSAVDVFLKAHERAIYSRWRRIYARAVALYRPETVNLTFEFSTGSELVYCFAWTPAPFPFRLVLSGFGVEYASSTAIRVAVHSIAAVTGRPPTEIDRTALECEIAWDDRIFFASHPLAPRVSPLRTRAPRPTETCLPFADAILVLGLLAVAKALVGGIVLLRWTTSRSPRRTSSVLADYQTYGASEYLNYPAGTEYLNDPTGTEYLNDPTGTEYEN